MVSLMYTPSRRMALTPELLAFVERIEADPGPEEGTRDPTDAELMDWSRALLAEERASRLHLFAYGSLIWNPVHEFRTSRRAIAAGWHRSFCMRITRWRGTREFPGLMMALDRGGACSGVLYELEGADHAAQIFRLLEREVDAVPATIIPRWINVRTSLGAERALTFVASPHGPAYAGRLPLEDVARITAKAAGHWGSTAEYLYRTVRGLEDHGIVDRNLWRLQHLVAQEILALSQNINPDLREGDKWDQAPIG